MSHPSLLGLEPEQDLQVKYYGIYPATGQVRISRKVFTVGAAMEMPRDLLGARDGDFMLEVNMSSSTNTSLRTGSKQRNMTVSGMLSMLNVEAAKRRVILESVTDVIFFSDCIIAKSKVRIN